jgi:hypothetical protein
VELNAFGVVSDHFDKNNSVLVNAFTDEQRQVLTFIPHNVIDAYFERNLTVEQRNDLVYANLAAVGEIISQKYASGATTTYTGAGRTFPRVDVTLADLRGAPTRLSEGILTVKDFQRRFRT